MFIKSEGKTKNIISAGSTRRKLSLSPMEIESIITCMMASSWMLPNKKFSRARYLGISPRICRPNTTLRANRH